MIMLRGTNSCKACLATFCALQWYSRILNFTYLLHSYRLVSCSSILETKMSALVLKNSMNGILQEAAVVPPHIAFATRQNPGFWEYVKVNAYDLSVEGISATEYLKFKEIIVDEDWYVFYLLDCCFLSVDIPLSCLGNIFNIISVTKLF